MVIPPRGRRDEVLASAPISVSKKQPIQHDEVWLRGPQSWKHDGAASSTCVMSLSRTHFSSTAFTDSTSHPQLSSTPLTQMPSLRCREPVAVRLSGHILIPNRPSLPPPVCMGCSSHLGRRCTNLCWSRSIPSDQLCCSGHNWNTHRQMIAPISRQPAENRSTGPWCVT